MYIAPVVVDDVEVADVVVGVVVDVSVVDEVLVAEVVVSVDVDVVGVVDVVDVSKTSEFVFLKWDTM